MNTTVNTNKENLNLGIIKISVSGYKSIYQEQAIDIAPLTLLAGANSSGKSSMLQPLLLLKQTLEARYNPVPLLLEGSHFLVPTLRVGMHALTLRVDLYSAKNSTIVA
jgi:predicted ATP-dependent endonuclease of OLD family